MTKEEAQHIVQSTRSLIGKPFDLGSYYLIENIDIVPISAEKYAVKISSDSDDDGNMIYDWWENWIQRNPEFLQLL